MEQRGKVLREWSSCVAGKMRACLCLLTRAGLLIAERRMALVIIPKQVPRLALHAAIQWEATASGKHGSNTATVSAAPTQTHLAIDTADTNPLP